MTFRTSEKEFLPHKGISASVLYSASLFSIHQKTIKNKTSFYKNPYSFYTFAK